MATYTLETPRGKRLTIESDSPEEATRLADTWDIEDHATSEAKRLGVNPDIALRQMRQESGSQADRVSPKGARGPMQLMPETAKGLGVDPDDPYANVTGGLTYYKQQLDHFGGDEAKALAAYNAGPAAVEKYGGVPPYRETQDYVKAIRGAGGGATKPVPLPGQPGALPAVPKAAAAPGSKAPVSQRRGFEQQFAKPYQHVANWIKAGLDATGYEPAPWLQDISNNLRKAQTTAEAAHPEVYKAKPGKTGGFLGGVAGTSPIMMIPGLNVLAQGAAMGAVDSDKKDVKGVLTDAALSAVTAKATDLGVKGVGKAVGKVLSKPAAKVMSPAQLETAKDAAYAAVDNSGVKFKPGTFRGLVTATEQDLKGANYNPDQLHGKVAGVMAEFKRMSGKSPTLTELDQFRQFARTEIMDGGTKGEQRLGKIILGNIDDFIGTAGAKQVLAGDPKAAAGAIKLARDLNTRVAKTSAVNEALDKAGLSASASGSGANMDNRARQEVLKVLKKTYNFTPDEEAAARKAIEGGKLQNLLRGLGKTSPLNGGLPGILSTLAVLPSGGTSLAWSLPTSGAKLTADAMTKGNIDRLLKLIAAGGDKAALAPTPTSASQAAAKILKVVRPALVASSVPALASARQASKPKPQKKK